jgi:hypothetical protein
MMTPEGVFSSLDNYRILVFPYFLGICVIILLYLLRNNENVARHGLQIIGLAVLFPSIFYAANKGWIDNNYVAGLFGIVFGFVFGNAPTFRGNDSNASK